MDTVLYDSLDETADYFHKRAMESLYSKMTWGQSAVHSERIENTYYKQRHGDKIGITWGYSSPHAAIVELGGFPGEVYPRKPKDKKGPFAIGKQQGIAPPIWRTKFKVQGPKNYMRGTYSTLQHQTYMERDVFQKNMERLINKLKV